jgi:hypothetical protein
MREQVLQSIHQTWGEWRQFEANTPELLRRVSAVTSASESWRKVWRMLSTFDTATKRATDAINCLLAEGLIEVSSADRAKKLVDVLFTPNTIYAAIAPDDGGVTFYWRARDMSIEIDIYPSEGYWWRVRNVAMEDYSNHGNELPIEQLKYSLTWFSKEVERANPSWRRQPV